MCEKMEKPKAAPVRKCHYSQHLGGAEFVVYTVLSSLLNSRGMSEITISLRHLTNMTIYNKDSIARALNSLASQGWIERFRADKLGGRYKPDTYGVNSHADWALDHPGQCCRSRP